MRSRRSAVLLAAVAFAAASFGMLPGCSHVEVVKDLNGQPLVREGRTIAHINASSWGIYLFNWIPLISGSRETPERFAFFRDTGNVGDAVGMLTRKSGELGATHTVDLQSWTDSWWQPWTLIIWMRAAYASGNAIASPPTSGG